MAFGVGEAGVAFVEAVLTVSGRGVFVAVSPLGFCWHTLRRQMLRIRANVLAAACFITSRGLWARTVLEAVAAVLPFFTSGIGASGRRGKDAGAGLIADFLCGTGTVC